MKYVVKRVTSKKQLDDFVALPRKIYRYSPYYVPDMESDVRAMFDRRKNPGLAFSLVQPFIAYDSNGNSAGRIVGIINHKANDTWDTRTVRFGMIEFIDDMAVSEALLRAVQEWGLDCGMTKIEGPMGITDFDKEGMLVEDFDQVGSFVTIYNPPYYPRHMEQLGFQKEADWVQMRMDVPPVVPERISRVSRYVSHKFRLHIRSITRHEVLYEGYAERVFELLNLCYKPLFGFSELDLDQCRQFVDQYLPLVDLRMIPVIEDADGRLVAVGVTAGSLSGALQKSGGRMWPLGWFHLLRALKFHHEDKAELLLIAVHPDYQGMGVNSMLIARLVHLYNELGYKWVETGPMLESNTKVLSQWELFSPQVYKRRRCFGKSIRHTGSSPVDQ